MLYRSKTDSVLWPEIFIATPRGTPARVMFRTAVLRKSYTSFPGSPAALQAVFHVFRNAPMAEPFLWKMNRQSSRLAWSLRSMMLRSGPTSASDRGASLSVLSLELDGPRFPVEVSPGERGDFLRPHACEEEPFAIVLNVNVFDTSMPTAK
jgi:hypothetical protein